MIVVTTPTGQIGREVLDRLLDATGGTNAAGAGKSVREGAGAGAGASGAAGIRVIARDPARLPAHVRENVEVVQGTHADPGTLKKACQGADRVFWLVPPTPAVPSVEGHFRDFTEPLRAVTGAQGLGVERVVGVSTLGRGVAKNAGIISASLAMDEAIAEMGVHYRALCAPFLMENLLGQTGLIRDAGLLALPGNGVLRTCTTRDIAAMAVRLLLDDSWTGCEDVPLAGPDDLSPEDMVRIVSEVLDRPVRLQPVDGPAYRAQLLGAGASENWARGAADMMAALNEQGFYGAAQPSTPDATPTGFRQWCEEVLKPAVLG
ncbi:NAD(P)H-binding protein [Streptomyces sp. NPDC050610]|uniref:NAD(P)H-binding protein n=1 Tax=Streptomyces sp. NPDC050610 TaxID=3157097 RepID=UPI003416B545